MVIGNAKQNTKHTHSYSFHYPLRYTPLPHPAPTPPRHKCSSVLAPGVGGGIPSIAYTHKHVYGRQNFTFSVSNTLARARAKDGKKTLVRKNVNPF